MVGRGINGRQATTTTRVHAATPQTSTKLTGRHTLLGTRSLFMYIMSNCVAWIDETQRFAGPPEALLPAFHLSPGGREIFFPPRSFLSTETRLSSEATQLRIFRRPASEALIRR